MAQFKGFRPKHMADGGEMPALQRWVIGNSTNACYVKQGSAVYIVPTHAAAGGGVDAADGTDDNVYGIVEAFVTNKGLALGLAKSSDIDGTFAEYPYGDYYITATDNLTDKKISVELRPIFGVVMSGLLSAAMGTTQTWSAKVGLYFDIETTGTNAATLLDESSVSSTAGTWFSIPGRSPSDPTDPDDPSTTRIMCQVADNAFITQ